MKQFTFLLVLMSVLFFSCIHPKPETETAEVIKNAVTDIDGNSYDAVKIGDKIWMASNLKTTHYANGDSIPRPANDGTIFTSEDYIAAPGGNWDNVDDYGLLYSYWAATKGVCPDGWHLSTAQDWYDLEQAIINEPKYLEKSTTVAKAVSSTKHWNAVSNFGTPGFQTSTNNSTGFSAVPADYYSGYVEPVGTLAAFWYYNPTGTNTCGKFLSLTQTGLTDNKYDSQYALSVRCVKE